MSSARVPTFKSSSDFQRLSRHGRKWTGSAFVMLCATPAPDAPFRLGLTVSRKVGNAVVRNRAKRRLREMVRLFIKENQPKGFEIVLIARTAAATRDFARMRADLARALRETGAMP